MYSKVFDKITKLIMSSATIDTFLTTQTFEEFKKMRPETAEDDIMVAYIIIRNWPRIIYSKLRQMNIFTGVNLLEDEK